jgi:hypothetical protein
MIINVHINYPDNIEMLEKKAEDLLTSILIEKFTSKEIEELVEMLEKDLSIEKSPNMGLENKEKF